MASMLIGWWQKVLALVRLDQQSRRQRWVEPSNAVTRAILSGAVPSLPALAPAAAVTLQYDRLEEPPELETSPGLAAGVAETRPTEESVTVVAAPGRAGRAA